ncbi:MAG: nuclease A inhibitor family protein [Pyrinomonadaceae bacterium]|nr:nuclease A inhibitor family protein [Pyrinomonadaceae bacterium]
MTSIQTKGMELKSDEEILAKLRTATAGLFVMSESDYPFELIQWDGQIPITPEYLLNVSGGPESSAIEEANLDLFFNANERFRNVLAVLKNNLTDLKVYKVGTINIPVYIVGRSPKGNWLGLSTRLIQT